MMNKKLFFVDFLMVGIMTVIFLFIDHRMAVGVLLGFLCSVLNYKLIEYRYEHIETYSKKVYLGVFLGIFILVLPLLMSFLLPGFINWIGAVIGLMIIRTTIIVNALINKEQ